MKKHRYSLIGCLLLAVISAGCGMVSQLSQDNSNKALADRAIETAIGQETTGVQECDEVLKMLAAEADNPDDGYVTKAVKGTFLNKIKESVRTSIEQNKNDKASLAKNCRDFKKQLTAWKADPNAGGAK